MPLGGPQPLIECVVCGGDLPQIIHLPRGVRIHLPVAEGPEQMDPYPDTPSLKDRDLVPIVERVSGSWPPQGPPCTDKNVRGKCNDLLQRSGGGVPFACGPFRIRALMGFVVLPPLEYLHAGAGALGVSDRFGLFRFSTRPWQQVLCARSIAGDPSKPSKPDASADGDLGR